MQGTHCRRGGNRNAILPTIDTQERLIGDTRQEQTDLMRPFKADGIAFRNARPISFGSRGFDLNILKAAFGDADAIRTHALKSYEEKVVTNILATKKSSGLLKAPTS